MSFFCYQGNDKDCGFACLKMLLAIKSRNKDYLLLSKKEKKQSFTFKDLIEIAHNYGLELKPYEIEDDSLAKLNAPFIALVQNKHAVVIKKVKRKSFIVYDPDKGINRMSFKDFYQIFSKYVLIPQDSKIIKYYHNKVVLIPFYRKFIQFIIAFLILLTIMIGFYFIKDNTSFGIAIGFLLFVVISQLVENWYIIKNIKYFDETFLDKYFREEGSRNKENYKEYEEFKKLYFASDKNLCVNLMIVLGISTLLIVNDFKNIFVILVILLVQLIDKLIFKTVENSKLFEISCLEKESFEDKNVFVRKLLNANNKANKFANLLMARKCIITFIVACLAILIMAVNNLISANYLIFHFGTYFVISNETDNILCYFKQSRKLKKLKARFIDTCDL